MTDRSAKDDLLETLNELLQNICDTQHPIGPNERLREYGLTSRLAAVFIARLSKRLERPLPQTLVWDHPTLARILAFLHGEAGPPAAAAQRALSPDDAVAVVGLACRFPGADGPEAFWTLLAEAGEAVADVPPDRWNIDRFYDPDPETPGRMSTRRGGFLKDVAGFDAGFFGISPREALAMDPQQRVALELAFEAICRSGLRPSSLEASRTGVFMGAMWSEYGALFGGDAEIGQFSATGRDIGIIANRISYALGLNGPSLTVDTACSASLVAVHLAVRSIRSGESRVALAGGVNLILSPASTIAMTKFGGMAPDGRSKAFDARADGYVRGEGAGIAVLMPLSDALAAGLTPMALIRGTAVNNDGPSNGLTAPNPDAQVAVIRDALADAGFDPAGVDFVEAHGTGTKLGDPIELGGIGKVYGMAGQRPSPLPVGSVKTNIGHLEAAAGMAGLTKAVLSMANGTLPPTLHQETPNPLIDFDELNLHVPKTSEPLQAPEGRHLRAGVSSFGFGGTNAHAILEAWTPPRRAARPPGADGGDLIFVYSGNGGYWPGVGRDLLGHAGFDAGLAPLCDPFQQIAGLDLRAVIADPQRPTGLAANVVAQLVTFAVQAGLTRAFAETGLLPAAVCGHSLGEISAAYGARLLTARDATRIVYHRSLLQARVAGQGAMALVTGAEAQVAHLPGVVVSGRNDRRHITISGVATAIDAAVARLRQDGIEAVRIAVDIAFHSPAMDPLATELVQQLGALRPLKGDLPFYSTVTGGRLPGDALVAEYFGRNLRDPVQFADAFAAISADFPAACFIEIGPHPLLTAGMRADLGGNPGRVISSLHRNEDGPEAIAAATDDLRAQGVRIAPPAAIPLHLFALSAKTRSGLSDWAQRIVRDVPDDACIGDLCRAAHATEPEQVRLALVAETMGELRDKLRDWAKALPPEIPRPVTRSAILHPGRINLAGLYAWRQADRRVDEIAQGLERDSGRDFAASGPADGPGIAAFIAALLSDWGVACSVAQAPEAPQPASVTFGDSVFSLPDTPVRQALFGLVARLWTAGADIDWQRFDQAYARQTAPLPPYPFQHRRFWPQPRSATAGLVHEVTYQAQSIAPAPGLMLDELAPTRPPEARGLDHLAGEYARRALADPEIAAGDSRWHRALARLADNAGPEADIDPALATERQLIMRVGAALPDILCGRTDALAVLFPDGDADLLTRLYGTAPFGRSLGDWIDAIARRLSDAGACRFVEVGAGTGATTARILPHLPARGRYLFTDVSPVFLSGARQRFGDTAGFSTCLFDAEMPPDRQGLSADADMVVAVNALHATRDIEATLRNMRALLRPGGHLMLGEVTGAPGWLDLVFGALEGWWRFDDDWREDTALLTPGRWREVLEKTGFEAVATREDGDRQSLVLARAIAPSRRFLVLGSRPAASRLSAVLKSAGHTALARKTLPDTGAFDETWIVDPPDDHRVLAGLADAACADDRFGAVRPVVVGATGTVRHDMLRAYLRSGMTDRPDRAATALRLTDAGDATTAALIDASEDRVILDGQAGQTARLRPVDEEPASGPPVRGDAHYLITGGLGTLGLHWARFLADRGARHLVLLGRRATDDPAVTALRRAGVRVTIVAADVTDANAVGKAIHGLAPPLAGVIHAAGQLSPDLATAAAPKIDGARVLDAVTQDCDLDVMLLVSSAAGTWGAPGWAGYAAANAALDRFAIARNATGRRTVSVGFGRFSEPGLLPDTEDRRLADIGLRAMAPQTALAAAWAQVAGLRGHVVVADVDWPVFRAAIESTGPRALFQMLPAPPMPGADTASAPATAPNGPPEIADPPLAIRRLLATCLGHETPDDLRDDLGFFEQGLDSLSAVRLARDLSKHFGRRITPATLFAHPTIADLARHLSAEAGAAPGQTPATVKAVAPRGRDDAVAIIGISARYPGGIDSYDSFRQAVFAGVDAVGEVPSTRWRWDVAAGNDADLNAIRWGGYLSDVDLFDAAFFAISPAEATYMDPQQRLLLEAAWRTFEHAGHDPAKLENPRIGVFVGLTGSDYAELARGQGQDALKAQAIMGLPANTAAGRIAHTLGLRGPAVVTDTACSSSLSAVHLACQALAAGDCDTALAGGANLILSPKTSVILARAGMLSATGRCRSFGQAADGFVRAEGCGMILMKPLSRAVEDGDPVLAVIRASAMNHDGRSSTLTAPNGSAQQEVIRAALRRADADPSAFGYVELHGTGTPLGDPVEAEALAAVYGTARHAPLAVGSLKSNVGHAESAAGIGGLIRAVAALQERRVPPSLHCDALNSQIPAGQFELPQAPRPMAGDARFAGVSSFGASGTNVHVVLETAPQHSATRRSRPPAEFRRKRYWIATTDAPGDDVHGYRLNWVAKELPDVAVSGHWQVTGEGARDVAAALRGAGLDATTDARDGGKGVLVLPPSEESGAVSAWLESVADLAGTANVPVTLLTGQGVDVSGNDPVTVSGTAAVALGRVLALKHPDGFAGVLDVGSPVKGAAVTIARALATLPRESEAALRGDRLWVPRLVPADAPVALPSAPAGTALVTGAFGGLGRILVRALFAGGTRHFALMSRRPDPALFADLVAQGAEILALPVDLTDPAAITAAAARIEQNLPPVRDILHLAGSRTEAWAEMLAVKPGAAQVLDRISAGWPVRRFLLAGSGAALWGDAGLPGYGAANGAMAAIASARRARGATASLIAFGPLAGTGMVDAENAGMFERIGLAPMDPDVAVAQALRMADAGQDAAIATIDWPRFLAAHEARRPRPMLSGFHAAQPPAPASPTTVTETQLAGFIRQSVADLLEQPVGQVDETAGFVTLGLDSFSLMDLRRGIERKLGRPIAASALFEAPSVTRLAHHLSGAVARTGMLPSRTRDADGAIAIIGTGMRLPGGVTDLAELGEFLASGRDGVGAAPPLRRAATRPQNPEAQIAGWLADVEYFDAARFRISPREAMQMDPQHRLLLHVAWDTMVAAGMDPKALANSGIGVFLGITGTEYADVLRQHDMLDAHSVGGRYLNAAAGRISHAFGLTGPSLVVDTACSSSAVALHMAVQALRRGECDMALAGGANLLLSDETSGILRGAGMLSPDGRCHSFDAAANGYVRAEGVGLVLLKPLSRAQAAGDDILAVLRGSAINHDGASGGFTVPNGGAQRQVMTAALEDAGVTPASVGYIEAHGTGTSLGDPIEAQALAEVYGTDARVMQVGSIKSNIGHAEAAAGIAGLLKLVAAARRHELPGNLHFNRLNPHIEPLKDRITVLSATAPWSALKGRRLAGLSSFGASGTNAHLLVEAVDCGAAPKAPVIMAKPPRVAFMFTGQGAQVPGMGRWLYDNEPVFRDQIDVIASHVDPILGRPLTPLICDPGQSLAETDVAQPALFAFETGLAALWKSRGAAPVAVLGHSLGEISAAAFAGLLTVKDAAIFTVHRGRAMATSQPGAMAAVLASEDQVRAVIGQTMDVAAINGPENTVISGAEPALRAAIQAFDRRAIVTRPLAVRSAFHSALMDPILPHLETAVAGMTAREGHMPVYCNSDGQPRRRLTGTDWVRQVRAPVAFAAALEQAVADGVGLFLEIGPRPVLATLGRSVAPTARCVAGFSCDAPDASLARAMAELWQHGAVAQVATGRAAVGALDHGAPFWPDLVADPARRQTDGGRRGFPAGQTSPSYAGSISTLQTGPEAWPDLQDSGYLAHVGVQVALMIQGDGPLPRSASLRDARFLAPLVFDAPLEVQRHAMPDGTVTLHAKSDAADWTPTSTARIGPLDPAVAGVRHFGSLPDCDPQAHYERLARQGLTLGSALRCITGLSRDADRLTARIAVPADTGDTAMGLSVIAYEALAQAAAALYADEDRARMVGGWSALHRTANRADGALVIHARKTGPSTADATLYGGDGAILLHAAGLTLLPRASAVSPPWIGEIAWRPAAADAPAHPPRAHVVAVGPDAGAMERALSTSLGTGGAGAARVFAYGASPDDADALTALIGHILALETHSQALILAQQQNAGALRGIMRTLAMERADLRLRLCEVSDDADLIHLVPAELARPDGAEIVCWQGGTRLVPRLVRLATGPVPGDVGVAVRDGAVRVVSTETAGPGAGEVEIAVSVAGINFRDVMSVQSPGLDCVLGAECGGRVRRTGPDVTGFAPGDAVVAYVPDGAGAARGHLTLDTDFVRRLPVGVSMPRAGAGLVAAMVARRGLVDLGAVQAGQRVFVHQAASATGLAATALARRMGADVVASAHTDKHRRLKAMGHATLIPSRDGLPEALAQQAGAAPIDLAIGAFGIQIDAIRESLGSACRIVDLTSDPGQGDAVDLDRLARDDRTGFGVLMDLALDDLADPRFLLPVDLVSPDAAADAIDILGKGAMIGRKAVVFGPPATRWRSALITGAAGGVGRAMARHLAQGGVTRLSLVDRARIDPGLMADLAALGAKVTTHMADVSDADAMQEIVARDAPEAILHTAASVEDQQLGAITPGALNDTFAAKYRGAQVLDRLTRQPHVAAFVLFSSVTAHLPSAGQASYAAANSAIEDVAVMRRAAGYGASVLAWGPWDIGIGRRMGPRSADMWRRYGISAMSQGSALDAFDQCGDRCADMVVLDIDWPRYARAQAPGDLLHELDLALSTATATAPLPRPSAAIDATHAARHELARVLRLADGADIAPDMAFSDLGLDSLMAGEFADGLSRVLGLSLSPTLTYNYPNLAELAAYLDERLTDTQPPDETAFAPSDRASAHAETAPSTQTEMTDLEKRLLAAEQYLEDDS